MSNDERILLAHGSGGRMSQQLIETVFRNAWSNDYLSPMLDGAVLPVSGGRLAVSTDSFVITPIFFPGGDIGKIAIAGTVNDLVACGAVPMYLTAAFIIEEGLPLEDLQRVVQSMAAAVKDAGVRVVTGDTKVVEKGSADKLFINTTGIGFIPETIDYRPDRIEPGDVIIVTGTVGDHGLAILAQREGLSFTTPALSDCAPLHRMGEAVRGLGSAVKCMRDPTRGGLATVLNELAGQSGRGLLVRESGIPVAAHVKGACDMLGMDPLYMANEGKMVLIVDRNHADAVMQALKTVPEAVNAAVIGQVVDDRGIVLMETELGARRILGMLEGEHLPRIC
ncbi:MAG: hydrogenase expression/formation protein HypE [Solirubrobacterales bacterium]